MTIGAASGGLGFQAGTDVKGVGFEGHLSFVGEKHGPFAEGFAGVGLSDGVGVAGGLRLGISPAPDKSAGGDYAFTVRFGAAYTAAFGETTPLAKGLAVPIMLGMRLRDIGTQIEAGPQIGLDGRISCVANILFFGGR